jgi:hypothetical protein
MSDTHDELAPFDEEQQKVIGRVEKLLRLAARNPNPEEAAAATAKAQELLAAYNLDASMLSPDEDKSAVREKMKLKGGMYQYQRDLYRAVAQLNFCIYWTLMDVSWVERNKVDKWTGEKVKRHMLSRTFQHYIVGRLVNTRSTRMMAEYLRQAIERLVNERYSNQQRWGKDAVAYREGIADVVVNRLHAKRMDMEREEARKRREAAANSGVSTATALTLAAFSKQEHDANMDAIYGEGYSARRAAERAERARLSKEAEEAYTKWAAANPEEARKEEQKREAERRKAQQRYKRRAWTAPTGRDARANASSYWEGRAVGETLSIDPQVSDRPESAPKRIARG